MMARLRSLAAALAAVELPVLALLIISSIAFERLLPAALIMAGGFWFVRWLAFGRPTVRTPGDWAVGLLVVMIPVTLWATALPEITRPQALRLLMGLALYYAVANWAGSIARLRLVTGGLVAVGLGLALLAPFLGGSPAASILSFMPPLNARLPQVLTNTVNPNVMAGALALVLPLALALPVYAWPRLCWFERALAMLASAATLVMLIWTQSRGAWLGIMAALGVLVALRWRWGWLALPLVAVAGGLAAWQIGFGHAVNAVLASQALGGADQRVEIWSRALYMLQDFPFTGIGMGTFRQVANLLYPFFLAGPDAEIPHAHNIFLQVGVDLGLPGLVAWLALLISVCVCAWLVYHRAWRRRDSVMSALGAGLLASQTALAVHGLTDAPTWGTRPAVVVWAIWGLAMAAVSVTTEPKPSIFRGASDSPLI